MFWMVSSQMLESIFTTVFGCLLRHCQLGAMVLLRCSDWFLSVSNKFLGGC